MEKDKILLTLVDKVKGDEANFKAQSEIQKNEIEDLQKQLAEAKLKYAVAKVDRDASEYWKTYFEKQLQSFVQQKKDVLKNLWNA
jgi:GTPase involved in cell partitioning and DNA repair